MGNRPTVFVGRAYHLDNAELERLREGKIRKNAKASKQVHIPKRIRLVSKVYEKLGWHTDIIVDWLTEPQDEFGGMTPLEVIEIQNDEDFDKMMEYFNSLVPKKRQHK